MTITFRASSVGKCAAELYRRAVFPEEYRDNPVDNPMELFLRMGHTTQAAVASYLEICGTNVFNEEKEVQESFWNFEIVGHIDGMFHDTTGEDTLLECKAIKSANFSPLWTSPHLWSTKYPHYMAQVQTYMRLSGLSGAAMVFIDRDNHKDNMIHGIHSFPGACAYFSEALEVDFDLQYFNQLLNRLSDIAQAIEAREQPDCDNPKYCYSCQHHHIPTGSIKGKGRGRKMETGERQDLIAQAMKAVKGAG